MDYDYETENNKTCPVCGQIIDYHVDGFIRIEPENFWYCRDHSKEEIQSTLERDLTQDESDFIEE